MTQYVDIPRSNKRAREEVDTEDEMDNTDQPSPPEISSVGCDSWTVSPGQTWKRMDRKKKEQLSTSQTLPLQLPFTTQYQLMINLLHFHLIYHQTTTGVNNSYNRLTLLFDRNLMKTLRPREPDMSSRKPSATSNLHLTPMLPPTDQNADMTKQHQPHLTATSL